MDVREAIPDDVADICAVAEASWQTDYPAILNRENLADAVRDWYEEASLHEELSRADAVILVADDDGDVVGFSHANLGRTQGDILRLYVSPDHRGAGVGSALLDATVETLRRGGAEHVTAMVLAENEQGNAFYRAAGFEFTNDSSETVIGGEHYREHTYVLDPVAETSTPSASSSTERS
jgi:ribosomal protein S18 acetylase RimI-like enzyme